jgi:hypothetical protein
VRQCLGRSYRRKEGRKEGRKGDREGLMDSDRGTKISESQRIGQEYLVGYFRKSSKCI